MPDFSALTDDELDARLLAQAKARGQKVAMIVGKALRDYETWDAGRITERVVALVAAGKLESAGDVRNWRFSEVRLPEAVT
jgi:predicted transcriptional regulator